MPDGVGGDRPVTVWTGRRTRFRVPVAHLVSGSDISFTVAVDEDRLLPEWTTVSVPSAAERQVEIVVNLTRYVPDEWMLNLRLFVEDWTRGTTTETVVALSIAEPPVRPESEEEAPLDQYRTRGQIAYLNFDFHSMKGHYKSMVIAERFVQNRGDKGLLARYVGDGAGWPTPELLVINGLHCFEHTESAHVTQRWAGHQALYLHESVEQIRALRDRDSQSYGRLRRAFAEMPVWFESQRQLDVVTDEFDVARAEVVLPCVDTHRLARSHVSGRPTWLAPGPVVAMAGSVQPRKGTQLFCDVAALFAAEGRAEQFIWVGPGRPPDDPAARFVRWVGAMGGPELVKMLASIDVLFLSSRDDPMPLVGLEALAMGARVVCSANVGLASHPQAGELITVFDDYRVESAASAIVGSVTIVGDAAERSARARDFAGPERFIEELLARVPSRRAPRG